MDCTKTTGWYTVVHFGPNDEQSLPLFLYPPVNDATVFAFTANFRKAFFTQYVSEAERVAERVREELRKTNNPLKDKIKVVDLLVREIKRPEEE